MPDPKHELRILSDATGQKLADKIFDLYKGNLSNRAAFHIALDRLLSEMGCKAAESEDADEAEEEIDDDDADEDIHGGHPDDEEEAEIASIDDVKDALRRVVARASEKK